MVNLGYRDELITPLTLKQELSTISHKWFEIGMYFKVQPNTLKTIKQTSETNTEVCLMKLCKEWLGEEQGATWSMVVHMLESETISEAALANSIKNKYCNSSQSPDESPESLIRSWVCILYHSVSTLLMVLGLISSLIPNCLVYIFGCVDAFSQT